MAARCTYHQSTYFSKQLNRSHKKAYLLKKNIAEFSGEKIQKNGPAGRKRYDRKSNRTRQKNNTEDSKVESNDSPEIPDRGETSDKPGLPSGSL